MARRSPASFLPDTSCMVALTCGWHEHHVRALEAIEGRQSRGERMIVAAPALVEAYAVLTRLPAAHRLAADVAATLLDANFVRGVTSVALRAVDYRALLRSLPPKRSQAGAHTMPSSHGAHCKLAFAPC